MEDMVDHNTQLNLCVSVIQFQGERTHYRLPWHKMVVMERAGWRLMILKVLTV